MWTYVFGKAWLIANFGVYVGMVVGEMEMIFFGSIHEIGCFKEIWAVDGN
jgi:hypothetical protein